jgi:hypothetical protein
LVLHDLETDVSYWVHVTRDRIRSTGKGSKILVPTINRVDADHLDALLAVALGERHPIRWEGSVWQGGHGVMGPDRLRYALLTPRLIAPHQNRTVEEFGAEQTIALLMRMRLTELQPSRSPYQASKAPNPAACANSPDWNWRFYSALYRSIANGEGADAIQNLALDSVASAAQRAAAAAMSASLLVESHLPRDALTALESVLESDDYSPIDHAWLSLHSGRCLAEIGEVDRAVERAVQVQALRKTRPDDPTAAAIVGAAADLIFSLSNWGASPIADVVAGRDTLAAWWRTQEVAAGLEYKASEDFKTWAQDRSITWGRKDQTWLRLRAASLIAGATGDHRAWRTATSQLAQHTLTTSESDADRTHSALSMARFAGDTKSIALAVPRVIRSGSIPALQRCCNRIDLEAATRTTLRSDIEFVERAADVLPVTEADNHAQWALNVLADPSALRLRLKPAFLVAEAVLDMLASLVPALSGNQLRSVIDHVVSAPTQDDQGTAHGYAKIVFRIPQQAWTSSDVSAIRGRPPEDNFELREEFESVLAAADESHRVSLQERIAGGDLAALEAYGDVRDLSSDTVVGLVQQLSAAVSAEVSGIESGQSDRPGRHPAAKLIIVNAWHPDHANWQPIIEILGSSNGFTYHLHRPLQILQRLASHVPRTVAEKLEPVLREIMTSLPRTRALTGDPDVRGDAAALLELLRPSSVTESEIWELTLGSPEQRVGAARVLAVGRRVEKLDALAAIGSDGDPQVSEAVANLLVGWLSDEPEHDLATELLRRLIQSRGMGIARAVATRLDGTDRNRQLDEIAMLLRDHASAFIRRRISAYAIQDP